MKLSLSQRVIVPSSALFVLLQVGLAACVLNHERSSLLRQVDSRAKRLATRAGLGTTSAGRLGETLLEQEGVVFCEVQTVDGQVLCRGGTADAKRSRHYAFPVGLPGGAAGNAGTLSLALSTAKVHRALAEARGMIVVAILANTALAAFIVSLIVRRTIGNSLTRLVKEAKIASAGYVHQQTAAPPACDEFEQLTNALRAMATRLREMVDKQNKLAAQAAAEPTPLEHAARK